MEAVGERHSIGGELLLAADVCIALAAFALALTGHVRIGVPELQPPDVMQRIERLARSCLGHPAARGRGIFWSSEVATDARGAERTLACAVVPIWLDRVQVGFLGIVDTWLPELDEEQRAALAVLAAGLAPALVLRPSTEPVRPSGNGSTGAIPHPALAAEGPRGSWPPPPADAVRPLNRASRPDVQDVSTPTAEAGPEGVFDGFLPPTPSAGNEVKGAVRRPSAVDPADLVGALDDGVLCLDGDGTVVVANRPADVLYGLGPGTSLVGSPLPETHSFRTEAGEPLGNRQPGLLVLRDGVAHSVQVIVGENESQRRFTMTARPFTVGGSAGALVVMHDTTEEWLERQRLSRYAMYDPLTGLANRYLLLEELRRMLQGLGRRGGAIALVYLDLDRFKVINDEYGHDMGDEVLSAVARRLRGAVRGDDVVARLGGDEFVLAHLSHEVQPDGDLVVSRLRKVLSAPFRVRGQVFDVGASIGWVSSDRADVGPDALLARADRAMYRSKRERAALRSGQ